MGQFSPSDEDSSLKELEATLEEELLTNSNKEKLRKIRHRISQKKYKIKLKAKDDKMQQETVENLRSYKRVKKELEDKNSLISQLQKVVQLQSEELKSLYEKNGTRRASEVDVGKGFSPNMSIDTFHKQGSYLWDTKDSWNDSYFDNTHIQSSSSSPVKRVSLIDPHVKSLSNNAESDLFLVPNDPMMFFQLFEADDTLLKAFEGFVDAETFNFLNLPVVKNE